MTTNQREKSRTTKKMGPKKMQKRSVLIYGSNGRMGQELIKQLKDHPTLVLAATVDATEITAIDSGHTAILKTTPKALAAVLQGADVVIDFSSESGTQKLCQGLDAASDLIVLIGTTGLPSKTTAAMGRVAKKRGHKILMAGNTSLGVATLARLSVAAGQILAPAGFDIEITETHHRMKADSPSGTALLLASMLKDSLKGTSVVFRREGKREPNTIAIHSIRGGGVIGEHEVRFISDFEEIKLTHRAFNRSLFADGALNLVVSMEHGLKPGMAKNLKEFLSLKSH